MALFKLINHFESKLEQLEKNKSKCFIIRKWNDHKIMIIKDKIKELRTEIDLRKTQPYQEQDYK